MRLFEFFNDESRITLKHIDSKFFQETKVSVKQKATLTLEELHYIHNQEEIALIKHHLGKFGSMRDAATEGLKCPYTTMHSRMKILKMNNKGEENEKNS